LQEQATGLDHGLISGAEVFAAAIDHASHALLNGPVLGIDPIDAGERLGLLNVPIEQVVVQTIAPGAKRGLVDVRGPVAEPALEPVLVTEGLAGCAVFPVEHHGGLVVHGYPDVPGDGGDIPIRSRGTNLVERQDEMIGTDVDVGLVERPDARVLVAIVGQVDDEPGGLPSYKRICRLEPRATRPRSDHAVQDGRVRGIDPAFEPLQPVGLLDHLGDVTVAGGHLGPGELGQGWLQRGRPHVCPDDSPQLDHGVGGSADLVRKAELFRLVHHVHALAGRVELPPVIHAAQSAVLVSAEEQGCPSVWTVLVEQAELATRVPEGDEILAE
jgi:hypothetical protein